MKRRLARIDKPNSHQSILLREYIEGAAATDRFSKDELKPIVLGLFGEVGSIMATAKKHRREEEAYVGYRRAVEEEFGDALWYFAALCRRLNFGVDEVLAAATRSGKYQTSIAATDLQAGPISEVSSVAVVPQLEDTLLRLGESTATLLLITLNDKAVKEKLVSFADCYLHALQAAGVGFAEIVRMNLAKTHGRFIMPDPSKLPTFDSTFSDEERLPDEFEIIISQRKSGQSYLQMNGVFIGDPLTDNIEDPDGYRYHDVFHFAHAAILHWSPTFRALIKHKRKSNRSVEEAQDSGRAIVVEEGLSAWIFSRAKQVHFFKGHRGLSFDLLKTVSQFVSGYEVEQCPLKLWEDAILQAYAVFREVRTHDGGIVIGSRSARRIEYRSAKGK
jgi:hypothetical protein